MSVTTRHNASPGTWEDRSPRVLGALALGAGLTAAGGAQATLIITDVDVLLDDAGDSYFLDLNGDGQQNFKIKLKSENSAEIRGLNPSFGGPKGPKKGTIKTQGWISQISGFAINHAAGTKIDDGDSPWNTFGKIFDGSDGGWPAVGSSGYIGLALNIWGAVDGQTNTSPPGAEFYGWIHIARGSVGIDQFGFEDVAGVAAQIPDAEQQVPEPGTLLLLASGAAGLLSMRRRRQRSAAR